LTAFQTRFAYATRLNGFKADAARVWPGRNRITSLDLIGEAVAGTAGTRVVRGP
jgi:hypothetical protein